MGAMAQFIPDDPREKDAVEAVLNEHPELQPFIADVSEEARRQFPEVRIELDTVGYDDWDPPLRMLIYGTLPWPLYMGASDRFLAAVRDDPRYDRELIFIFPQWAGPLETYSRR